MARRREFKRNSSGFMDPVGSVPSGSSSGPGHFNEGLSRGQKDSLYEYGKSLGLEDLESKAIAYGERGAVNKWKESRKKMLAGYRENQARHDKTMAGIAKAESDKFTRINDALNASKESDPKDKLGNTVPSKQTQYLEAQLLNILGQSSQKGRPMTPGQAGIPPEQLNEAGILKTRPSDTDATALAERGPGTALNPANEQGLSDLLNRDPRPGGPMGIEPYAGPPEARPPISLQGINKGDNVTGPQGKQYEFVEVIKGKDGRDVAVVIDKTSGEKTTGVVGVDIFPPEQTPYRDAPPDLRRYFEDKTKIQDEIDFNVV